MLLVFALQAASSDSLLFGLFAFTQAGIVSSITSLIALACGYILSGVLILGSRPINLLEAVSPA